MTGKGSQELKNFFTYLFTLNVDSKTKTIDFDFTSAYFPMFFQRNQALVDDFLLYLDKDKGQYKLKIDEWKSFYDFIIKYNLFFGFIKFYIKYFK
mgnify:CR=1 FL=1